ncbi:MAG: CBS domain-containing protein [Thiohalospira sp.]
MTTTQESTVAEVLQTDVLVCGPAIKLDEAARRMRERNCSSIIITEQDRPVGIWTEHDATRLDFSTEAFYRTAITEVMSSPLKTIPLNATIDEAAMRFREERVRHFVAIGEDGRLAGILTQTDVTLGHSIDHYLTLRPVTTAIRAGIPRLDAGLLLHAGSRRGWRWSRGAG